MTDTTHCLNCGEPTGYDSDGPLVLLRSDNLQAMRGLFKREFDQSWCKVCHHKFHSTPTVVVNFSVDASIVMVPGDLFRDDYASAMTRLLSNLLSLIRSMAILLFLRLRIWRRCVPRCGGGWCSASKSCMHSVRRAGERARGSIFATTGGN